MRIECLIHLPHVKEKTFDLSLWLIDTLILLNSSFASDKSGPQVLKSSLSRDNLYINVILLGVSVVHLAQERRS